MLTQHKLGQKRFDKKFKRKNKKYTGPKYSRLEQLLMVMPLLERAGIIQAEAPDYTQITGDNSTLFTE
jgi:hypothetical protein